jgi:hypothetical protein
MPTGNLRQLVDAFDTLEDPTIQQKLSSVKKRCRGDSYPCFVSWRRF